MQVGTVIVMGRDKVKPKGKRRGRGPRPGR